MPRIARFLGVKPQQVENGAFGEVNCKEGVLGTVDIDEQIAVKKVGDKCVALVFRTPNNKAPRSDVRYHNILALCAAPPGYSFEPPPAPPAATPA